MSQSIDTVVVGAGVVGLAIGRAAATAGHETLVLESEAAIGTGISSRNSEVIHAGIYYPPHSLKATFCVDGREALYRYCAAHGIAHWRCGKLIVATTEPQIQSLQRIAANARASGVLDLRWLDGGEARAREPELRCVAALESPSTGVIDSYELMLSLRGEIEACGGSVACAAPLIGGEVTRAGIALQVGGVGSMELVARHVVNAAGLEAQRLAHAIIGVPSATIPPLYYAKGNYYALSVRAPFAHLIYPIPEPGGLGVHLTLDLAKRARFGPDVEWVRSPSYDVDPARSGGFYTAIRDYWPGLPDGSIHPDYAGIRPKLSAAGARDSDFAIQGPETHGVPGLIQLFGIESPGLTSSLAIADDVAARLTPA